MKICYRQMETKLDHPPVDADTAPLSGDFIDLDGQRCVVVKLVGKNYLLFGTDQHREEVQTFAVRRLTRDELYAPAPPAPQKTPVELLTLKADRVPTDAASYSIKHVQHGRNSLCPVTGETIDLQGREYAVFMGANAILSETAARKRAPWLASIIDMGEGNFVTWTDLTVTFPAKLEPSDVAAQLAELAEEMSGTEALEGDPLWEK